MMGISLSTYHYDPKITREEKERQDADIREKIEQIRVFFPRAGYRPLIHHLKRHSVIVGETRLRRILKESGLFVKPLKRFVKTTDSNHNFQTYPNLLPEMTIDGENQVWASDITYIRIDNGFVYLAVILDLFLRKAIGWAISKKIDRHLTLDALKMALQRRNPPKGVIHHSDRGVQYMCTDYIEYLKENGFFISCSAKGNPYDNAWVESFMKTLKNEEIYLGRYDTWLDVVDNLPEFIEEVYNKKRPHSSLGYLTPEEFEQKNKNNKGDGPSFNL